MGFGDVYKRQAYREFNGFICKRGVNRAHGPYLLFSEELAQCSRFTAAVAGADVDFILQHDLYVGDGYDQLRNIHAASHAELVDYRNRWCSSADGKIESFLV